MLLLPGAESVVGDLAPFGDCGVGRIGVPAAAAAAVDVSDALAEGHVLVEGSPGVRLDTPCCLKVVVGIDRDLRSFWARQSRAGQRWYGSGSGKSYPRGLLLPRVKREETGRMSVV